MSAKLNVCSHTLDAMYKYNSMYSIAEILKTFTDAFQENMNIYGCAVIPIYVMFNSIYFDWHIYKCKVKSITNVNLMCAYITILWQKNIRKM